jgi:hypothetical protein
MEAIRSSETSGATQDYTASCPRRWYSSKQLVTSPTSIHLVFHPIVWQLIVGPIRSCALGTVFRFSITYGGSYLLLCQSASHSHPSFHCLTFLWRQKLSLHHWRCNWMAYHWHFNSLKMWCNFIQIEVLCYKENLFLRISCTPPCTELKFLPPTGNENKTDIPFCFWIPPNDNICIRIELALISCFRCLHQDTLYFAAASQLFVPPPSSSCLALIDVSK